MKLLKTSLMLGGLVGFTAFQAQTTSAQAPISETVTFNNVNLTIPDNDPSGLALSFAPSFGITNISSVTLTLNIEGTWNGDLYGYLTHDTGFSVLLNRVGRDNSTPLGYSDKGFNITFNDQLPGANDIHSYHVSLGNPNPLTSPLTGTWMTDGRNVSPFSVNGTEPRDATLNSFVGLNADGGNWTLFLTDLSAGDESVLKSWSLTVIGVPVPEPNMALLILGGALGGYMVMRRRNKK